MMPYDWILGLSGGLLIGVGGAIYLLVNGRIMGASGILGGLVDRTGAETARERLAFLLGVVLLPALLTPAFGRVVSHITNNMSLLIIAGLCVGVGTRMANGCTSGHGVCGISRLSWRGIVATLFYIGAGGVTVLLFRHVWGIF